MTDKGYYYAANKFSSPEHGGTHIDAPIHFAKQKQMYEQKSKDGEKREYSTNSQACSRKYSTIE